MDKFYKSSSQSIFLKENLNLSIRPIMELASELYTSASISIIKVWRSQFFIIFFHQGEIPTPNG